jgi:hypothetical protein
LTKFTNKSILKFLPSNPSKFLPIDSVSFKLRAKNTKRIIVRVFEVKTLEYLQSHSDAIGQSLSLDGLSPNWEHVLEFNHPPIEEFDVTIDLPELANRRGAFIMDVIGNGENSTAYFTKGYFDFVEHRTVAGHVLNIIDENQQQVDHDVVVRLDGHIYKVCGSNNLMF